MIFNRLLLTLTLLMASAIGIQAQSNELAFTVSDLRVADASAFQIRAANTFGGGASFTRFFKDNLGVTVDGAVSVKGRSFTDSSLATLTIGPTFKANRKGTVQPFVHGLVGLARLGATNQILGFNTTGVGLAVIAGGGVDIGLSGPVSFRVGADYVGTWIDGAQLNNVKGSAGLVVRF